MGRDQKESFRVQLRWLMVTLVAPLFYTFLIFQNCAKVNFTGDSASEAQKSPQETLNQEESDPLIGGTHGDGYDGKVTRYLHWSKRDECVRGEVSIKNEIHQYDDIYTQVLRECEAIPAIELPSYDITLTSDGLIYQGENYANTYPASCYEIYQRGGDPDNGFYEIDPDGDGPQSIESTYCDMNLTSGGWGPWSDWNTCDVQCGQGEQSRQRSCNTNSCTGPSSDARQCQLEPCP